MSQITKDQAEDAMVAELRSVAKYVNAINALSDIFGEGTASSGLPFVEAALFTCAADGIDGVASNDSVVNFPDELANEYGGPEERFGYIQMGIIAFPNDEGLDQVPFDEALRLIEIAAKHYVSYRPDRKERVDELMAQARKSFARLQKNHEAWKRRNMVS